MVLREGAQGSDAACGGGTCPEELARAVTREETDLVPTQPSERRSGKRWTSPLQLVTASEEDVHRGWAILVVEARVQKITHAPPRARGVFRRKYADRSFVRRV